MDTAALRRRREHLQLRLRRPQESAQARALGHSLRTAGVRRLSRLPVDRLRPALARFAALPERDERFHWPEIAGHHRQGWLHAGNERDAAVIAALRACFAPAQRLVLVFHPAQSALVVDAADLVAHCASVLDALHETLWIVPLRGPPALVEVSVSDGEVCWLPAD